VGYQSWGIQGETVEILYFGPLFCKIVLSHKLFCHLLNYAFDLVIMGFGTRWEGDNGQMWRSHAKLLKNLARGLKIEEIFKPSGLTPPPPLPPSGHGIRVQPPLEKFATFVRTLWPSLSSILSIFVQILIQLFSKNLQFLSRLVWGCTC